MHAQTEIRPIGFTLASEGDDKGVKFTSADLNKSIGAVIRADRKRRRMNQTVIGDVLGVSYQQVGKIESGENGLSAFQLLQIASIFGASVLDIFTWATSNIVAPEEDETEVEVYSAIRCLRLTTPHELKSVLALLRSMTHGRGMSDNDGRRAA